MLESLLVDLEKHLGIHSIKGSHERTGYFHLQISALEDVWVTDLNPGVFIQTTIGSIPTLQNYEDFFGYLMRANFLGQGTGNGVIGLDPDEKFLTLSLKIPYEVSYRVFRDELEKFLNYLGFWREEIKKHEARQL